MYRRQAHPQSIVSVVALFKNRYTITGGYRCVNREKPHAYRFNHFHVCAKNQRHSRAHAQFLARLPKRSGFLAGHYEVEVAVAITESA